MAVLCSGRNENAVEQLRKVLILTRSFRRPGASSKKSTRTWAAQEAVAEREKALSLSGGPNWRLPSKRFHEVRLQRRLAKLAGRPDELSNTVTSPPTASRSRICAWTKAKSLRVAGKAYEEHDSGLFPWRSSRCSKISDPIRDFKEILRRMKLSH